MRLLYLRSPKPPGRSRPFPSWSSPAFEVRLPAVTVCGAATVKGFQPSYAGSTAWHTVPSAWVGSVVAKLSSAEREQYLAELHVGVIAVERPDRAPLSVPIWYWYEPGGEVWIWTEAGSVKDT